MNKLPFAVQTNGSSESKTLLIELYEKHVGPVTSRNTMVRKNDYPVLIFRNDDVFHAMTAATVEPGTRVLPFEEGVSLLVTHTKFIPIVIRLNSEYTAVVQENGSVQVGCQTFSKEAIKELISAVNSVDKR